MFVDDPRLVGLSVSVYERLAEIEVCPEVNWEDLLGWGWVSHEDDRRVDLLRYGHRLEDGHPVFAYMITHGGEVTESRDHHPLVDEDQFQTLVKRIITGE